MAEPTAARMNPSLEPHCSRVFMNSLLVLVGWIPVAFSAPGMVRSALFACYGGSGQKNDGTLGERALIGKFSEEGARTTLTGGPFPAFLPRPLPVCQPAFHISSRSCSGLHSRETGGGNMRLKTVFAHVVICFTVFVAIRSSLADTGTPVTGSDPGPALEYALGMAEQGGVSGFDASRVASLVDFAISKEDQAPFSLPEQEGLTGSSFAFTTRVCLKKVLQY